MRKVVNVTHISLDGVMERMEEWHLDCVTDPDPAGLTRPGRRPGRTPP